MKEPIKPIKRNPGSFSIQDNKLRIQNLDGQSSVLFEDISSISYKTRSTLNTMLVVISILLFVIGEFIAIDNGSVLVFVFFAIVGIAILVYTYNNKIKWDDVIVETRGGMLLTYSVDFGNGSNEVNRIENAKRQVPKYN